MCVQYRTAMPVRFDISRRSCHLPAISRHTLTLCLQMTSAAVSPSNRTLDPEYCLASRLCSLSLLSRYLHISRRFLHCFASVCEKEILSMFFYRAVARRHVCRR